ncbi:MAG: hypothetical protein KJO61_11440 [Deltaproteobacteria bacterium]|nr:hypothetical protein [Deltaproteobacteria bacterium]
MKIFHVTFIIIISAIIISGCSSYGNLVVKSKNESEGTIEKLIKNSDDYDIHHFGYGTKFVSGIIFNPKNDNKDLLLGDMWMTINEPTTISDIVTRMKGSDFRGFNPTLYKIVGPDGVFYGYLFTGWSHVVFKKINDDTMSVYGLKDPPEYLDSKGVLMKSSKL